jgi:hypothetical protein
MNAVLGELKDGDVFVSNEVEENIGMQGSSELSDVSPSDGGSETASASTTETQGSNGKLNGTRIDCMTWPGTCAKTH